MHTFNTYFLGKSGIAGCPLDSQPPVILILSILTGFLQNGCPSGRRTNGVKAVKVNSNDVFQFSFPKKRVNVS